MLDTTSRPTIDAATSMAEWPKAGFRLVRSEVLDLTPDVLKEFRALPASPTERELRPHRLKHLQQKAQSERLVTFHWVTVAIANEMLRMNGQHSSEMLTQWVEQHGVLPSGLKVHREHYEARDRDSAALLFQQFDDRVSSRSSADVAAVYQGLRPELAGLNKKIAKKAIDGYCWEIKIVQGGTVIAGDERYALFNHEDLYGFLNWFGDLQSNKTRELQADPVVAAIWATFNKNEAAARSFWEDVATGANRENDGTPAVALDHWLLSIDEGEFEKPIGWKPVHHFQGCIYAWNNARENKLINAVKYEIRKNTLLTVKE